MRALILGCLLATSCTVPDYKEGQVIKIGSDSFRVALDTQHVLNSERMPPANVTEEHSPRYRIITNNDTFTSMTPLALGEKKVYVTFKKIGK